VSLALDAPLCKSFVFSISQNSRCIGSYHECGPLVNHEGRWATQTEIFMLYEMIFFLPNNRRMHAQGCCSSQHTGAFFLKSTGAFS
jgi:hypothetical protein